MRMINKALLFDMVVNQAKLNHTLTQINEDIRQAIIACEKLAARKPLPPNVSAQIRLFTQVGESRLITASGTQAIRVPMGKYGYGATIKSTSTPNVFAVTATKKRLTITNNLI